MTQSRPALLLLLFFLSLAGTAKAQVVLQIEKKGNPLSEKIPSGTYLEYQLNGDKNWYQAYIENIRPDINTLVLGDRYVKLDDIAALRFPRTRGRQYGTMLTGFGLAWSGFALVGTATDGNPDTQYEWSDAIVTATATGAGLLLNKLTRYRKRKKGKTYRFRIVDLNFQEGIRL